MVEVFKSELTIGETEIIKIQELLNLTFPESYKNFLLKNNGGKCNPKVFSFFENNRKTESYIEWFLAIYSGKFHNLKKYLLNYKLEEKRMPTHIFPIAHDPGGNLICISCSGVDIGSIYFWNHELEVDYSQVDDSDYLNLYLIDENFQFSLNKLH